MASYQIYPLENYRFGVNHGHGDQFASKRKTLSKLEESYSKDGMRRTVAAVMLVNQHDHPHLLMLQDTADMSWRLPGGTLHPGENDIEGLKRKLNNKVAPETIELRVDWEIGDLVAVWWKSNFDTFALPYVSPHISKPKECQRLYLIHLPKECTFACAKWMKLIAVPLFELYNNGRTYGPVLSAIPQILSRHTLHLIALEENTAADVAMIETFQVADDGEDENMEEGDGEEQYGDAEEDAMDQMDEPASDEVDTEPKESEFERQDRTDEAKTIETTDAATLDAVCATAQSDIAEAQNVVEIEPSKTTDSEIQSVEVPEIQEPKASPSPPAPSVNETPAPAAVAETRPTNFETQASALSQPAGKSQPDDFDEDDESEEEVII